MDKRGASNPRGPPSDVFICHAGANVKRSFVVPLKQAIEVRKTFSTPCEWRTRITRDPSHV